MSKEEKTISYTVNDEAQFTSEKELTANQIMTEAGIDTETNYLSEVKGSKLVSYKDNPVELIKMHNNQKFITTFTGPTKVA
ncbi:hypothetical protein H6781_02250 [Candidatus Nomurabacteria bacterium]|nr:hypothetical protein [Candidatus Kaiserbacteria bacterium]MCB9810394.1 hypothetical protein [Candidatus Nomurabacteria bacterium]MCB9818023.1 hypothetical protein [Candidatus Nomurabacteria bacterium]